jgi:sugar phosphate permease
MSALGQSGHTQLRYSHTFCNSASGIYLAGYFFGGLVGTAVLGLIFDGLGWPACVAGIGLALTSAACLAIRLRLKSDESVG